MRKIISLLAIYSVSLQLSAQKFNIAFAESPDESHIKEGYALPGGGFIGMKYKQDDRPAVAYSKRTETISIFLYDAKMKPIKENRLANGERVFGIAYTTLKKIGNKFWLIYTEQGERNDFGDFKALEINPATLETGAAKTIVSPARSGFKVGIMTSIGALKIEFKASPNEKHGCLFIRAGKKNTVLCATDNEMNTLWTKQEIATDIDSDPGAIDSWQVDNAGNVLLGYTMKDNGHVAIYKNGTTPQILNFGIENGSPKEVLLLPHKNNTSISIAGGYFEKTKNVQGIYKSLIDASLKLNSITKTPFTETLVQQFDNDGWGSIKPNKHGIEPEYIAQLFEINDNAIDMVIEIKHKVYTQNVGTIVHSGNILNVYFNNGSAVFTRIPKYNVAAGTGWPHYYALPFQDKMVIFYNDNPVNLTKDINASPKLVDIEDNSVLVAAVVQPDGSVERRLPIERQEKYMGVAEWIKPVAENRVQVPVYTKKRLSYATISFQ